MNLQEKDRKYVWHPFTHQNESSDLPVIVKGEGSWLYDESGNRFLDAVSSWWVNIHGHAHPHISSAITEQSRQLEQVIFAGYTHSPAIHLAEKLIHLLPGEMGKIFFSDDGSTSVEVALKMAIQYFYNSGKPRRKILAFENAYHGDTFGAMSAGGKNIFSLPFAEHLFEVEHLPVPVAGKEEECIAKLKSIQGDEFAAFIFEPLVQGSAGMVMYNEKVLEEVMQTCKSMGMLLIADEVFTGFGRTGTLFACDQLDEKPDIVCVSKGLTGGFLPMGITACREFIYNAFCTSDRTKTFFHGHSYTANPLACAAANASLELMNKETFGAIDRISNRNREAVNYFKLRKECENVRSLGTIFALDLKVNERGYLSGIRDKIIIFFRERNILVRPLGNVIYFVPPYCITGGEQDLLYGALNEFLEKENG